jgi:hypothetical protein
MQRYIFTERKRCRIWFLPVLLLCGLLFATFDHFASRSMETHVNGVAAHVGFSGDWSRRFPIGQALKLSADRSMPAGYERIYLYQLGEAIGSLPESSLARQVRKAMASRQPVQARITSLDPLDPARGLRVRIIFGSPPQTPSGADVLVAYAQ